MMTFLTSEDITKLRKDTEDSMTDVCEIGTPSYGTGVEPGPTDFIYGSPVKCGLEIHTPRDAAQREQHLPGESATLRLPLDTDVSPDSRIRIIQRHGELLQTSQYWSVDGGPQRGLAAQRLSLTIVEGEQH